MHQAMDRSKAKERYAAGKMRQHSIRALFFIGGFGAASWLTRPASMQPAFGLLAFLVALQALIAAYVYKKVL